MSIIQYPIPGPQQDYIIPKGTIIMMKMIYIMLSRSAASAAARADACIGGIDESHGCPGIARLTWDDDGMI